MIKDFNIKQLKQYIVIFVWVVGLSSCSVSSNNGGDEQNKKYNFNLYDYFEISDLVNKEDFDLKGPVKSMIKYKPTKSSNLIKVKRSKDFVVFFDKQGDFQKRIVYHSGNYFFQGKKKLEEFVINKDHKKELVENNFLLDTTILRLRNVYDKKGRLLSTENPKNKIVYHYNDEGYIIKSENFKNPNTIGVVNEKPISIYTFKFLNETHKVKKRTDLRPEFNRNEEHLFFYPDGSIKKTMWLNERDTTLVTYNKNHKMTFYSRSRNGKVDEKKSYTYTTEGLLVNEYIFKYSRNFQEITYQYDKEGNPNLINTFDGDGNLIASLRYFYTYDNYGNWLSRTSRRTYNNQTVDGDYITREISYH
jgi:hypothetical protein